MYSEIEEQTRCQDRLFKDGKFEKISERYTFPHPIYIDRVQIAVLNKTHLVGLLQNLRAGQFERGVTRATSAISAVESPQKKCFRVWLRTTEFSGSGHVVAEVDILRYCRSTEEGIRVEMTETSQCSPLESWAPEKVAAFS